MNEGKNFREHQTLLHTLHHLFEQFSSELSVRQPPTVSTPEILKKVLQKHQELINTCLERQDLATYSDFFFHHAPVPYLLLDTSQKIAASNLAATQLLTEPPEKLIGKELRAFVSEEHNDLCTAFFDHFPDKTPSHLFIKMVSWDGISFFAHMYCIRMAKTEDDFQYLVNIHSIDAIKKKE